MLNSITKRELEKIRNYIYQYQKENKKIFVSSSFQTHSIPLLHIIAQTDNAIPVYFLNTGFHFPETLLFKEQIGDLLGLQVIDVISPISKFTQLGFLSVNTRV